MKKLLAKIKQFKLKESQKILIIYSLILLVILISMGFTIAQIIELKS